MLNINRRQFFRIKLVNPLCAVMTVVQINDKAIKAGNTQVCIIDIGPGGLRFSSNLALPVSPQVILEFGLRIVNYNFKLRGNIVRKIGKINGTAEYGVKFLGMEELLQPNLTKALGIMLVRIKKGVIMNSCCFCSKDAKECWKTAT